MPGMYSVAEIFISVIGRVRADLATESAFSLPGIARQPRGYRATCIDTSNRLFAETGRMADVVGVYLIVYILVLSRQR